MKPATILLILGLTAPLYAGAEDLASLEQVRQSAARGSAAAQLEMGILYEFGYNMPKNDVSALAWYLLSAEQGNTLAVKRRDQLRSQMKPDEIDAAQKLSTQLTTQLSAKEPEKAETKAETTSTAPAAAITLDGELFTKKFVGNPPKGDKLVEFIREGETFDNWTKLVSFRYQQLPNLGNDPTKVAEQMAQTLKTVNPKANSQIIINKQASEAIIDFLTWPPDGKFMEFNVFRYAKSTDENAVVSLQLAYRFTDSSPKGTEQFKKIRASWINQAATFDIMRVHATLSE